MEICGGLPEAFAYVPSSHDAHKVPPARDELPAGHDLHLVGPVGKQTVSWVELQADDTYWPSAQPADT